MRTRLSLILAILVLLVPTAASATNIGGATYSPSTLGGVSRFQSTWRTANDSQTFYVNAKWDTTHRQGVQAYAVQGYRYTQDFRDALRGGSLNLHATGRYATTFLNPVYDRDDDNGDRKQEEAEITSNSAQFPSVNENYYADVQFSHWHPACSGGCYVWDPDGNEVGHSSQISYWDGLFGEWQTYKHTNGYRFTAYPYQTAPAGAAAEATSPTASEGHGQSKVNTADVDGLVVVSEEDDGHELDVRVSSPSRPQDYIASNKSRAKTLLGLRGPYRVVITFTRPLSASDFRTVVNVRGVEVTSVETVGLNARKQILTVGGDLDILDEIDAEFESRDGSLSGVVAAEGVVRDQEAYDVLSGDGNVLLVDVAPELVSRRLGVVRPDIVRGFDRFDVIVNDLYWMTGELPG